MPVRAENTADSHVYLPVRAENAADGHVQLFQLRRYPGIRVQVLTSSAVDNALEKGEVEISCFRMFLLCQ